MYSRVMFPQRTLWSFLLFARVVSHITNVVSCRKMTHFVTAPKRVNVCVNVCLVFCLVANDALISHWNIISLCGQHCTCLSEQATSLVAALHDRIIKSSDASTDVDIIDHESQ